MSAIDRLNRLVRANLNDLASRAAGKQSLHEVRGSLRAARLQLVETRVQEKRLVKEYESLLDQAQSWEERAFIALKGGNEPLAREALVRKQKVDQRAGIAKSQLDDLRELNMDISHSVDAVEIKMEALKERDDLDRLSPRGLGNRPTTDTGSFDQKMADFEAESELSADLGGSMDSTFTEFEEMASRLFDTTLEIETLRELSEPPSREKSRSDDLESRFQALETQKALGDLTRRLDSDPNNCDPNNCDPNHFDELKRRLSEE